MMRVKLVLDEAEYSGLLETAVADLRTPADQVRYMVREELKRRGLLSVDGDFDLQTAQAGKGSPPPSGAHGSNTDASSSVADTESEIAPTRDQVVGAWPASHGKSLGEGSAQ